MNQKLPQNFEPDPLWQNMETLIGFQNTINLYGPYLGAGVEVTECNWEKGIIKVKMPLTFYNKGYIGTHFGGSLYAMCDPFYMFLLMKKLGKNYMVWDIKAEIEYLKQSKGTVFSEFRVTEEDIESIKKELQSKKKLEWVFNCDVNDERGEIITRVKKTLYIRKLKNN